MSRKVSVAKATEAGAVSGRVWSLMTGGGLYKASREIFLKSLKPRLSFPFLVSFFSWMHQDTNNQERDTQDTKQYSYHYRESFKKITCQSNGKDSFTQVTDNLSDKFSTRFINDFHQFNLIIQQGICQGDLRRFADGALPGGGSVYFDWVRVRPYTEVEPKILKAPGDERD